jgi:hypothetical protein
MRKVVVSGPKFGVVFLPRLFYIRQKAAEQVTRFAVWPLFRSAFAQTLSDAYLTVPHLRLYPNIDLRLEGDEPTAKTNKTNKEPTA